MNKVAQDCIVHPPPKMAFEKCIDGNDHIHWIPTKSEVYHYFENCACGPTKTIGNPYDALDQTTVYWTHH